MKSILIWILGLFLPATLLHSGCAKPAIELERPEQIVSKRQVVYDRETYSKLAAMWKDYYDQYPSEDACANWMYAARYAGDSEYESMLKKWNREYPAHPTLSYLMGLLHLGASDDREGVYYLERAVELDPLYVDAWFGLAIQYMSREDDEKFDIALRHLLEGGAISDEIMDYSYNMMAALEKDAILITNGDNDTYPGWILGRITGYRPDITIVNRSLLNTDWYPGLIQDAGIPKFIRPDEHETLRREIIEKTKREGGEPPVGGPFGDTLISRLIESAGRESRPVYFSATLYRSEMVAGYVENGQDLGLVTLVNPAAGSYGDRLKNLCETWLNEFRTAGLDGWNLRNAKDAVAGRQLAMNYPAGIYNIMEAVTEHVPEYRLPLFRWYRAHLDGFTKKKLEAAMNDMWCGIGDIPEISLWCRTQGF